MELWNLWISLLQNSLTNIAIHLEISEAMAIIFFTLLARTILMPVSLTSALRMEENKKKIKLIKPEIDALRELYKDDKTQLAAKTMRIYRENKISLFDRFTIASIGTQGIFGIGIFQAISQASFSSKFLWITNLAKPDFVLTLIVSVIMLLGMVMMPGATAEQSTLIMMAVSVVVLAITLSALPSAAGLYWAASNTFTLAQTLLLRMITRRQSRFAQ